MNRLGILPVSVTPQLIDAVSAVAASADLTGDNVANATAGKKVTIGTVEYVFKSSFNTNARAAQTLTSDNTNVADAATVTIGTTVYRFKDTMAQAYDVKRGSTADESMNNLRKAINGNGTPGTEYYYGTVAHPDVTAGLLSSHAFIVTANTYGAANNSIATEETSTHLSWGNTTLLGGDTAVLNQVKIGASADATLGNLIKAINGSGVAGTDYSTGTVAHPLVSAGTLTSHVFTITARTAGEAGNSIVFTTDEATYTAESATLEGGVDAVDAKTGLAPLSDFEGGSVRSIIVKAPSINGSGATCTVKVLDADGDTIYVSGNLAENATTLVALSVPLQVFPTDVIKITASVSATGKDFTVKLR